MIIHVHQTRSLNEDTRIGERCLLMFDRARSDLTNALIDDCTEELKLLYGMIVRIELELFLPIFENFIGNFCSFDNI